MLNDNERITSKKVMKEWLEEELSRYGTNNSMGRIRSFLEIGETGVLSKYHILLRKSEYHTNTHHKIRSFLYRFRLSKLQNKYAIHIPLNCAKKGLRLMHVGPILWNANVSVGENCTFHMNTSLVAGDSGYPVLQSRVWMGVGATVVGGVQIAENVMIGANAVVSKSVSETNISVAGVPAHKVKDKTINN